MQSSPNPKVLSPRLGISLTHVMPGELRMLPITSPSPHQKCHRKNKWKGLRHHLMICIDQMILRHPYLEALSLSFRWKSAWLALRDRLHLECGEEAESSELSSLLRWTKTYRDAWLLCVVMPNIKQCIRRALGCKPPRHGGDTKLEHTQVHTRATTTQYP